MISWLLENSLKSMGRSVVRQNKIVIFCLSYLNVPVTLSLISKSDVRSCDVFTGNNDIADFFIGLGIGVRVVRLRAIGCGSVKCLMYKTELKALSAEYAGGRVYFFGTGFCELIWGFVKMLSSENEVIYSPEVDVTSFVVDRSFESIMHSYIVSLLMGVRYKAYRNGATKYLLIDPGVIDFIAKRAVVDVGDISLYEKKIISLYVPRSAKVLYAVSYGGLESVINKESYGRLDELCLGLILRHYGAEAVCIKRHPSDKSEFEGYEAGISVVPPFVPANTVLSQFDVVYSVSSALLFEFANKGGSSYSLIKLFCGGDAAYADGQISYLDSNLKNGAQIFYVSDVYGLVDVNL